MVINKIKTENSALFIMFASTIDFGRLDMLLLNESFYSKLKLDCKSCHQ